MRLSFPTDGRAAGAAGLCLAALLAVSGTAATPTLDGVQVMAPPGFVGFCGRAPVECSGGTDTPSDVDMTAERWLALNEVNDYVNRTVARIDDRTNYGVRDFWTFPNERGGDCEDLALEKRRMLIERGWPVDSLLLATAKWWWPDEDHVALIVVAGGEEYVLDSASPYILPRRRSGYVWLARQSRYRPFLWVSPDIPTPAAARELPPIGAPIFLPVKGQTHGPR